MILTAAFFKNNICLFCTSKTWSKNLKARGWTVLSCSYAHHIFKQTTVFIIKSVAVKGSVSTYVHMLLCTSSYIPDRLVFEHGYHHFTYEGRAAAICWQVSPSRVDLSAGLSVLRCTASSWFLTSSKLISCLARQRWKKLTTQTTIKLEIPFAHWREREQLLAMPVCSLNRKTQRT